MGKILVPKEEFEAMQKKDSECCSGFPFSLLSIIAVLAVATSAMSWIAFINIKKNGGKLPWENS